MMSNTEYNSKGNLSNKTHKSIETSDNLINYFLLSTKRLLSVLLEQTFHFINVSD